MPSYSKQSLTLVLALALLSACKPGALTAPNAEGTVSSDRGNVKLGVGGHVYALRTLDGKALDALDIQIGSQIFHTKDGKLTLPESALAAIRTRGAFLVRAPGYVPRKVGFDAQGDVSLVPVGARLAAGTVAASGGRVAAGSGAVGLDLPMGMLAKSSDVGVNAYHVPAAELDPAGVTKERSALIAAAGKTDRGCDHPLPCPPPTSSIGLLVDVNGPVQAGTVMVSYDLNALAAAGYADAVARLRATFAAIDASNDPSWRKALEERYGITLEGDRLTFPVKVGDGAFNDGVARIEVDALGVLGVRLEVTVLSQAAAPTGGNTTPDTIVTAHQPGDLQVIGGYGDLITNDGGSIITNDGGSIVASGGGNIVASGGGNIVASGAGNLIGNDGASLITNDGGSLIPRLNALVAPGGHVLTDNGNLLVAGAGGSLIGNDGASLISLNAGGSLGGYVDDALVPGAGPVDTGKYHLFAPAPIATGGFSGTGIVTRGAPPVGYGAPGTGGVIPPAGSSATGSPLGVPVAGVPVKLMDARGIQYGPTLYTDASGHYATSHLPTTWNGLVIQATVGNDVLRTLAPAPGGGGVTANLGPASSGIAAVALDAQSGSAQTLGLSRTAFKADVQTLEGLLTFADARYIVTNNPHAVASYVRGIFTTAGKTMQLNLPAAAAPPPPLVRPVGLGTAASAAAGTEIQIHGTTLPAGAAGLRVDIGGLAAPFSRMPDPNDWFVTVPPLAPVGPTTLTIYFNDGVNPESVELTTPFSVTPPTGASPLPTVTLGLGNFAVGAGNTLSAQNLPPANQLAVTLGGVSEAVTTTGTTLLNFTIDSITPLGPQQLVITWFDPAGGPQILVDQQVTVF